MPRVSARVTTAPPAATAAAAVSLAQSGNEATVSIDFRAAAAAAQGRATFRLAPPARGGGARALQ